MSDKITENRGALSFQKQVHALSFQKQVHALSFQKQVHVLSLEHKIISNHPENMRFSLISSCTFMRGDTVVIHTDRYEVNNMNKEIQIVI